MLNIIYGDVKNSIYNTNVYFDNIRSCIRLFRETGKVFLFGKGKLNGA